MKKMYSFWGEELFSVLFYGLYIGFVYIVGASLISKRPESIIKMETYYIIFIIVLVLFFIFCFINKFVNKKEIACFDMNKLIRVRDNFTICFEEIKAIKYHPTIGRGGLTCTNSVLSSGIIVMLMDGKAIKLDRCSRLSFISFWIKSGVKIKLEKRVWVELFVIPAIIIIAMVIFSIYN